MPLLGPPSEKISPQKTVSASDVAPAKGELTPNYEGFNPPPKKKTTPELSLNVPK